MKFGLPTAPARRFVSAGGLSVVHDGVCEYELIADQAGPDGNAAHTIVRSVVRSTGTLSRPWAWPASALPSGPLTPVEGLQMTGQRIVFTYAIALDKEDPYALADEVLMPLEVVNAMGGVERPARRCGPQCHRGRGQCPASPQRPARGPRL